MKKIGLIGGTSWHSTIVYYRLINEMVGEKIGTQANPELLIYSLNIELMREQNKEKINKKYLEIANTLQNAGAEALVICANTPHMVFDFVQPKIEIPILHIADAIGKEAREKGLKTLGLLGNRPTMTGDFIPKYLKEHYDIDTIIPDAQYHRSKPPLCFCRTHPGNLYPGGQNLFPGANGVAKSKRSRWDHPWMYRIANAAGCFRF